MRKNPNKRRVPNQAFANFESSNSIEGTQYTKYKNSKGGGEFAAEDANILDDILKGKELKS